MQLTPFRACYPRLAQVASIDGFLQTVKEEYLSYTRQGIFQSRSRPAFYIYRISTRTEQYTGVIGGVPIREFLDGKIRAHEKTIAKKEQIQAQLLGLRQASVKPILLSYPEDAALTDRINELVREKTADFYLQASQGEEEHLFWCIEQPEDIRNLEELFRTRVRHCYIADGHHRIAATALLHREAAAGNGSPLFEHLFCAFFSSRELRIFDFKRIVRLEEGHAFENVLIGLSRFCDLQPLTQPALPEQRHQFTMYHQGQWYRLSWKRAFLAGYERVFDAILLHDQVFHDLLGVAKAKDEQRITYLPGMVNAAQLEARVDAETRSIGFCLFPLSIEEIFDNTDEGVTLPPKSTWFEPRLKNGLLVMDYNNF